ncbi:MAG: tail fiber domain-containing protein [Acidobacteria bacterium]|nr:tail fiber domain-containing protein [Acidobacteriota bacterium]
MKKTFLFAVFAGLLCAVAVSAQTTTFTYQGKLTDIGSNPTGSYDFTFQLYDSLTAGNQIGSDVVKSGVSVSSGQFSAQLDFGSTAFSDGSSRYLAISVRPANSGSYTLLSPRQQITSAPYAIRSLSAAAVDTTAGNAVVNSINNAATNVTISSSRLANDVVKLAPSATQTATASDGTTALVDVGGTVGSTSSRFRFNHDGGLTFSADASGNAPSGSVPTTGAGYRMMWYPGKYAFRAGKVDSFGSTYWDSGNIGVGSIGLGENVKASGDNSFAANLATTASGAQSVALGNNGTASGDRAFTFNGTASGVGAVAIGSGAQATNDDSLALGPSSIAGGLASVTIGPSKASGAFGVAIGLQNNAAGNFSVAIGKNATTCSEWTCSGTVYQGAVTIGDGCAGFSSDAVVANANNQVNIRGCGGFRFFTNQAMTAGVQLASGGGSWSSISDKNAKENFKSVDPRDVLHRLLKVPVSTWNYKSQDVAIRHIGPMAQDFKAAFNVGESDKMITSIDPDGVAFAAIQGLYQEIKDRDAKNVALRQQLDILAAQNDQLNARLTAIERRLVKPTHRSHNRRAK